MIKPQLSFISLVFLNVAIIGSLKNTPTMAEYGFSSIFYYLLAALIFFIPLSLISAELASTFHEKGGVFLWTSKAFGEKIGFIAVWLQWMQSVIWFPAILSFAASTIAFVVKPSMSINNIFVAGFIFIFYWIATFITLKGLSITSIISKWGVTIGTLFPSFVLVSLALIWIAEGHSSTIPFTFQSLIPNFDGISSLVLIIGTLLSFTGMEVNAVHIKDVKDPPKTYPKAIFTTIIIILSLYILTTLAIAIIIPQRNISLTAGVIEAIYIFFQNYNIIWVVPIMSVLLVFGIFAGVLGWIAGPSKGLFESGLNGLLPPFFHKTNKAGIQSNVLLVQGAIVTIFCIAFLLIPSVSNAFFLLTALEVQLYMLMYIILFLSALKLRKSTQNYKNGYKAPMLKLLVFLGIASCAFAIILGFIPPSQLNIKNVLDYSGFLIFAVLIISLTPILIYNLKKPNWK